MPRICDSKKSLKRTKKSNVAKLAVIDEYYY
jgi:hypothetical protein